MLWLKKLYLQLYSESEACVSVSTNEGKGLGGPRPLDALSAFGGQVDKYRELSKLCVHCFKCKNFFHFKP